MTVSTVFDKLGIFRNNRFFGMFENKISSLSQQVIFIDKGGECFYAFQAVRGISKYEIILFMGGCNKFKCICFYYCKVINA